MFFRNVKKLSTSSNVSPWDGEKRDLVLGKAGCDTAQVTNDKGNQPLELAAGVQTLLQAGLCRQTSELCCWWQGWVCLLYFPTQHSGWETPQLKAATPSAGPPGAAAPKLRPRGQEQAPSLGFISLSGGIQAQLLLFHLVGD